MQLVLIYYFQGKNTFFMVKKTQKVTLHPECPIGDGNVGDWRRLENLQNFPPRILACSEATTETGSLKRSWCKKTLECVWLKYHWVSAVVLLKGILLGRDNSKISDNIFMASLIRLFLMCELNDCVSPTG